MTEHHGPTDAEQRAVLAELHAEHDWSMPHDVRHPEWDVAGCPPNCPFRLAVEAGTQEIIAALSERIEPGAEQAHRDDLARDVARLWMAARRRGIQGVSISGSGVPASLADALDRLAAAYDFNAGA